jgi:hypothetical protein
LQPHLMELCPAEQRRGLAQAGWRRGRRGRRRRWRPRRWISRRSGTRRRRNRRRRGRWDACRPRRRGTGCTR